MQDSIKAAKALRVGDKVKCIDISSRDYQLLHPTRNRLVLNKIYEIRWVDCETGHVGLKNKRSNWLADRFVKI